MRISNARRPLVLAFALLGASCAAKNQHGDIIMGDVLVPTYTPPAGTVPAVCTCPTPSASGGGETVFLAAGAAGLEPCITVFNHLPNNANGTSRLNTNDFMIQEIHLTYQQVAGTAFSLPAGEVVLPASGLIPSNAIASVPAVLVPAAIGATFPAGAGVRVRAYFRGKLEDNSMVNSSEYDYTVIGCGGACSTNCMNSAL